MRIKEIEPKKQMNKNENIYAEAFEHNMKQYKKSIKWVMRITADEFDITENELCEILTQYYSKERVV